MWLSRFCTLTFCPDGVSLAQFYKPVSCFGKDWMYRDQPHPAPNLTVLAHPRNPDICLFSPKSKLLQTPTEQAHQGLGKHEFDINGCQWVFCAVFAVALANPDSFVEVRTPMLKSSTISESGMPCLPDKCNWTWQPLSLSEMYEDAPDKRMHFLDKCLKR